MRKDKAMIACEAHVLGDAQRVNSQFSRVKIRVCYDGENRHGEVISKEALARMAEGSLRNVPIVGHYLPEVDNFGGHDMAFEIEGNELKLKNLTQAYGVVPESTDFVWETVTEKNGFDTHDYLTCDGILWTGRYPTECNCILEHGMNQSMELMVNRWGETADGRDEILDGEFSALCILGKSDDPDINVEPCYEKAGISSYSLNDAAAEIMEAYKASLEESETDESSEMVSVEESDDIAEAEAVEESAEEASDAESETDEDSDIATDDEQEAAVEEALDPEPSPDYEAMYREASAQVEALNAQIADLTAQVASMTTELESLREYRRSVEEAQIEAETRDEFADLDGDVEFEALLAQDGALADKSALWEKCYAMRGKKNKPQSKSYQYQGVRVPIGGKHEETKKPYNGLVDDYIARHK